jgi:pyridoxine kinase
MTKSVLTISSQVIFGPVGNTAAVPALQAAGFAVMQIPTIILSAHPGHGTPAVQRIDDNIFNAFLDRLQAAPALQNLSGVMTGYFASPAQVLATAAMIKNLRTKNPGLYVLVDPVLGDEEGLYVAVPIAKAIKDHLVPLASCITPNRFELQWLSDKKITNASDVADCAIPTSETLATSIPDTGDLLLTIIKTAAAQHSISSTKLSGVPHGTGDFLSGLYLSARLHDLTPSEALTIAMTALTSSISASLHQPALDLDPGLRAMRLQFGTAVESPNQ